MSEDEDLIRTRNTRTGEARKIDEWSVQLPGGQRARFDVTMRYEHGICLFGLLSDHPDFGDVHLVDSDMNSLRAALGAEVRRVIEGRLSEGWLPSAQLEVRHHLKDRSISAADLEFSLRLRLRAVDLLDAPPSGNFPTVTVRDPHRQERVTLRAHSEDFAALKPRSGKLTDPEVMAWLSSPVSRDEPSGLGRTVRPGSGAEERALLAALDRFASALSDRLAPDRVAREGIPDAQALVRMMDCAVQAPSGSAPT